VLTVNSQGLLWSEASPIICVSADNNMFIMSQDSMYLFSTYCF